MLRGVHKLVLCILLCAGTHVFAGVIRYDEIDGSKQSCCTVAANRRAISLDDITPGSYAEPAWTSGISNGRSQGPSWILFLAAISLFIAAKITLLYRPVHRLGVAYARLYHDVFSPLNF